MSEEQPPDDPDNVKPTPVKIPSAKDRSPPATTAAAAGGSPTNAPPSPKTADGRVQLDQIRKERLPSVKTSPAFRSFPILKLNDCSKNCSRDDDDEDKCDFLVKDWKYQSQSPSTTSSISKSNCKDSAGGPEKKNVAKRAEPPNPTRSAPKEQAKSRPTKTAVPLAKRNESPTTRETKETRKEKSHTGAKAKVATVGAKPSQEQNKAKEKDKRKQDEHEPTKNESKDRKGSKEGKLKGKERPTNKGKGKPEPSKSREKDNKANKREESKERKETGGVAVKKEGATGKQTGSNTKVAQKKIPSKSGKSKEKVRSKEGGGKHGRGSKGARSAKEDKKSAETKKKK